LALLCGIYFVKFNRKPSPRQKVSRVLLKFNFTAINQKAAERFLSLEFTKNSIFRDYINDLCV